MIDGFKKVQLMSGTAFVSITSNGLNFNKNVVLKMDRPKFISIYLNDDEKLLAIQSDEEQTGDNVAFVREKTNIANGVRVHNRELERMVEHMMQWDLESHNYRIDGFYDDSAQAMMFDLKQARIFRKKNYPKK